MSQMAPATSTPATNSGMGDTVNNIAVTNDSPMRSTRPLWVDPDQVTYPPVSQDVAVDVCVIGGGITGVGAARWLEQADVSSVAVLEARTLAAGASGRNAGFVMAVAPENFPVTHDDTGLEKARRIWSFTAENQRLIEETIAEFGLAADYRKLGSLGLAAYEGEWHRIRTTTELARAASIAVELVPRSELPTRWLRNNYYGGAWYPDNSEIDPGKFVRGLAAKLAGRGTRFFEASPVASLEASGSTLALRVGEHRVTTERIIVATNAYTLSVLPDLGRHMAATRGQVLATVPLGQPFQPARSMPTTVFSTGVRRSRVGL